jgi:hypothetical protein
MDNQRPDYFDRYFEEDQQKKDKVEDPNALDLNVPSESEKMFDESLFTIDKDEQVAGPDIDVAPSSFDTKPAEAPPPVAEKPYTIPKETKKEYYSEYDTAMDDTYDYEKITRKGKFFKILIFLIAITGVIYLIIHYLPQIKQLSLFSKKTSTIEQIPPEEKLKSEQEIKQENFLNSINKNNRNRLEYINRLISFKPKNIYYSSIFLYGNMINIEIFGSRRDDLAKFNMQLKSNKSIQNYNIHATDFRPGRSGGFFSLYNFKFDYISQATSNIQGVADLQTPESWLTNLVKTFNMTVKFQREIYTKNENLFKVSRREFILQGDKDKCFALINNMANANSNYSLHKLIVIPSNQKNITSSLYQINLIMDFYLK